MVPLITIHGGPPLFDVNGFLDCKFYWYDRPHISHDKMVIHKQHINISPMILFSGVILFISFLSDDAPTDSGRSTPV